MMKLWKTKHASSRAFALIEVLVVAVILIALAAFLLPKYLGSGKTADGKPAPTPMSRAHDTECTMNIRQVRQSIEGARATDTDSKNPASLAELKLPSEMLKCPVGKEPYAYDSQTGQVHCIYPGHEKF